MSPRAGAIHPAEGGGVQRELAAAGGPARAGTRAGEALRRPPAHELLHLPPMSEERVTPSEPLPFLGVRARPATPAGRLAFYRSLEELASSPAFRERLAREFPAAASELDDPAGRREFLRLMGASLAL